MIRAIEHTAIASPDPEALAQWYVDRLGFVLNYHSATSKTCFVKAPNGSMIEIVTSQGDRAPHGMRDPGLRHLAMATDDFDAEYARLRGSGVRFLTEPEGSKGTRVVFFTDPDGNILHLIQREKPLP